MVDAQFCKIKFTFIDLKNKTLGIKFETKNKVGDQSEQPVKKWLTYALHALTFEESCCTLAMRATSSNDETLAFFVALAE